MSKFKLHAISYLNNWLKNEVQYPDAILQHREN